MSRNIALFPDVQTIDSAIATVRRGPATHISTEALRIDPNCPDAFTARSWLWATCPDEKYRDGKKALLMPGGPANSVSGRT